MIGNQSIFCVCFKLKLKYYLCGGLLWIIGRTNRHIPMWYTNNRLHTSRSGSEYTEFAVWSSWYPGYFNSKCAEKSF